MFAGFRPRTTRSFCFGKRTQNHWRPCVALRVPLPQSRLLGLRNSLRSDSPRPHIEFSGLGRSHARRRRAMTPSDGVFLSALFLSAILDISNRESSVFILSERRKRPRHWIPDQAGDDRQETSASLRQSSPPNRIFATGAQPRPKAPGENVTQSHGYEGNKKGRLPFR